MRGSGREERELYVCVCVREREKVCVREKEVCMDTHFGKYPTQHTTPNTDARTNTDTKTHKH